MKYIILYLASVLVSASLLGYAQEREGIFKDGLTSAERWETIFVFSAFPPAGIILGGFIISYSLAKGK